MTIGLSLAIKATIILIAALGIDALLSRRHVLLCTAIWNAALIALLVLPIAALALPELPLPLLPSAELAQSTAAEISGVDSEAFPQESPPPSGRPGTIASDRSRAPKDPTPSLGRNFNHSRLTLETSIVAIYVIGLAVCLIRLAVALTASARLQAAGPTINCPDWQERLSHWRTRLGCRPVELRQSTHISVPLMVGLLRPAILLPQPMAADLEPRSRDAVIVHELAHVLRGDFTWQLVLRLVQALLWFHPLIWLAERRIHFARERACDDFTIHALGSGLDYANSLLAIASRLTRRPVFGLGLAITRTSQIAARIEAIAASNGDARCRLAGPGRLLTLSVCLSFAGLLGSAALVRAQQSVQAQQPAKPAATPVSSPAAQANENQKTNIDGPGIVTGDVLLAAGGAPVTGATVLLRAGRLHKATTDDAGRFRYTDIPQGHYQIWAFKEPLASPKAQLIGEDAGAGTNPRFAPVRLLVRPGKQINVTVTSAATGKPIEGAKVELGYPDRRLQLTANNGTAALQALLPESYQMTILAAGHARALHEIDLQGAADTTSLAVALAPGGTLHGTVTGENRQPLAEAKIVFRSSESPVGYYGESPYADAQGQYRNLHLPLNTPIEVSASLKDYLYQEQEVTLTTPNQDLELNFQLQRRPLGGSVAGLVTGSDGQPVAGASVDNFGNSTNDRRETTTDQAGRFTLHDLVKNHIGYEIVVRAPGFVPAQQKTEPGPAEKPAAVSIRLEKGHSIRARVQNTAGQPVSGAFIDVNGGAYPGKAGESLRSDARGEFTSNSLPLGSTFRVYADGYSTLDKATPTLDQDQTVVLTLEPTGVIRGQVTDAATGAPVHQFRVRLGFSEDLRPGEVSGTYRSELGEPGLTFQTPDGSFTIHELTSRLPFKVIVEADSYEQLTLPRVVADPEATAAAVNVPLKKRESINPAALSGQVIDHKGAPVSGVHLRLIVSTSPSNGDNDNRFNWALIDSGQLGNKDYVEQYLSAVTGDDGKFELKELLPGKFLQLAYWGKSAPKGRSLALAKTKPGASQSVTIRLPEPAAIRGSFDADAYADASRISLSLQGQSFHRSELVLADGKSNFAFENLPPGKYWLSVVGQPQRHADNPQMFSHPNLASRLLTVEPGQALEVRLTKDDQVQGAKR